MNLSRLAKLCLRGPQTGDCNSMPSLSKAEGSIPNLESKLRNLKDRKTTERGL